MSAITFKRSDIQVVEEEVERELVYGEAPLIRVAWTATLEGPLSTREFVQMSRTGKTANEAMEELLEAAAEQGWVPA